jgi:hypothetical protein
MFEDGHRKLGLAGPLSGIIGGCTTRCAGDPQEAAEFIGGPAGSMAGASGGVSEAVYEGSPQAAAPSAAQPSASHGQIALLGEGSGATGSLFEPELFTWANESWTVTDPNATDSLTEWDRDADTAEIMGCVTAMTDGLEDSVRIPSQRIRFGMDSGRAATEFQAETEFVEPTPEFITVHQAASVADPVIAEEHATPARHAAVTGMIPAQQSDQAERFIPASQFTDPAVWGGPIVVRSQDTEGPATQPQPFAALVEERWTPITMWHTVLEHLRSLRKPTDPALLNKSVWLSFPPAPAWVARVKQQVFQPVRRTGRRWEPSTRSVPLLAALVVLAAASSLAVVQATSRELRSSAVEAASIGQVGADVLPGFSAPKVVKVPAPAPAAAPAPSAPVASAPAPSAPSAAPAGTAHPAAPAAAPAVAGSAVAGSAAPHAASASAPKPKLSTPSRSRSTATHPSHPVVQDVADRNDGRRHRSHHHSSSRGDDRDDNGGDYYDDSDSGGLLGGLLGGGLGGLGGGGLGGLG